MAYENDQQFVVIARKAYQSDAEAALIYSREDLPQARAAAAKLIAKLHKDNPKEYVGVTILTEDGTQYDNYIL